MLTATQKEQLQNLTHDVGNWLNEEEYAKLIAVFSICVKRLNWELDGERAFLAENRIAEEIAIFKRRGIYE